MFLSISFSQGDKCGLNGNFKEGSLCVFGLFSDEVLETMETSLEGVKLQL
jgi:hypothetical protein